MSTTCKYCNEPENKQDKPGLICECCICFVHLDCLRRPGTPGDFTCDVFFDFTCEDCSPDKKELFKRNKFPWVNVILLTLHHLSSQSYAISNHGYFHYKTHICAFIDRHWHQLFGFQFKQKKNWVGTIAGVLSVYNSIVFQSGSSALGETGWWKLLHAFSPATAKHILQEMARYKSKGRPRNQMTMDRTLFIAKVTEMGYKDLINHETDGQMAEPGHKRRRLDTDEVSYDQFDYENRSESIEECIFEEPMAQCSRDVYSDGEGVFRGFEFPPSAGYVPPSDSSSVNSFHHSTMFYDSDSRSRSPAPDQSDSEQKPTLFPRDPALFPRDPTLFPREPRRKPQDKTLEKRDSLFSTELNSVGMPWVEKVEVNKDLVPMTQYEEVQLLKQIEGIIPKVKDPNKKAHLCRLKAKLALRRLKRHKHLPLFDVDKTVKLLGGYITEEAKVEMNTERVLDRFQRSYLLEHLSGAVAAGERGARVAGAGGVAALRSAYSGTLLRPFIRRDAASQPLYLRFLDELLTRTNRHIKDYKPPPHATIDYSYVRPHHIPAVNSLCAQFFWPGIDLTEALEYPEFSCVVTYKKLVIGCAFLVPDVGPNEAYISFVLTRPEWRNAKIASFMLYHLLQTCTGKDVTLHVSPTNPAIFLYQKFGFKVEELVQDFYEKYFDMDYKGCRHALFLRLVR